MTPDENHIPEDLPGYRAHVERQAKALSDGLVKVFFGDYDVVLSTETPDPVFGNLAMLANVVINSARKAIRSMEDMTVRLRKEAESAQRAEARARAIVDTAFNAVITTDEKGIILDWNAAAESLFACDTEKAIGKSIDEFIDDVEEAAMRTPSGSATGRTPDGRPLPIDVAARSVTLGETRIRVFVVNDCSEKCGYVHALNTTLDELAHEKDVLRVVLEAASDAVFLFDENGKIAYASRALANVLDVEPENLRKLDRSTVFEKLALFEPDPAAELAAALSEDVLVPKRFRCRFAKPTPRTYEITSARPLRNNRSNARLLLFRDVTAAEAERRAKDELIGNVSHELRTPLTSIRGFVDFLRSGRSGVLTETQTNILGLVRDDVQRLSLLVADLLDIDRVDRVPLKLEKVDLIGLVREVTESERRSAESKGLVLRFAECDRTAWTTGDSERLRQVVQNLVTNAVKYTPAGEIDVSVADRGDGWTMVEVKDTGVGIPVSERRSIFERFFRSSHPLMTKVGGNGLGLAIVQAIVARHGGWIEVDGAPSGGSIFRVGLKTAAERSSDTGEIPLPDGAKIHALIISADRVSAAEYALTLESLGITVETVYSLGELLRASADGQFQLVVVDDEKIGLDLESLAAQLRRKSGTRGAPIIALSGSAECLRPTCVDALLVGPVAPARLRTEVSHVLSRRRTLDVHTPKPSLADRRRKITTDYLRHLGGVIADIRQFAPTMNESTAKQWRKLVHDLRGSAGSFGFHDVSAAAAALEDAFLAGSFETIPGIIDALEISVRTALDGVLGARK